jgi:ACR3 family arsenite efflux pump ArsB
MAWHDATVPVITALLAWWWFTNCVAQCDLVMAFIIISCSPSGVMAIVWEQVAAPGSLVAFIGHSASGLDLGL